MLVATQATVDLFEAQGLTPQSMSAALLTQNWLGEELYDNAVNITRAGTSEAFNRLPDGSYVSGWGEATRLTVTGRASLCKQNATTMMLPAAFPAQRGYKYVETYFAYDGTCPSGATTLKAGGGPVTISLKHLDDGSTETFELNRPSIEYGAGGGAFPDGITEPGIQYRGKSTVAWPIKQRAWPDGRLVSYTYDATNGALKNVSTSTGFSLALTYAAAVTAGTCEPSNINIGAPQRALLQRVTDNTGRYVQFTYGAAGVCGSPSISTVRDPRGMSTTYGWMQAAQPGGLNFLLTSVKLPGQSVLLTQIRYDGLGHVSEIEKTGTRIFTYAIGSGVGALVQPDSARSLQVLNRYGAVDWGRDDATGVLNWEPQQRLPALRSKRNPASP